VVAVGDTGTEDPDKLPGNHAYVEAPIAVNVALPPLQIAGTLAAAVTAGRGY